MLRFDSFGGSLESQVLTHLLHWPLRLSPVSIFRLLRFKVAWQYHMPSKNNRKYQLASTCEVVEVQHNKALIRSDMHQQMLYQQSAFHSMAPCVILLLLWSCWGWLFLGPRCFSAQITNMSSVVPSSSAPRSFTLPQCGTCPSIISRMQTSFLFRIGLGIWNLDFSCLRVSF